MLSVVPTEELLAVRPRVLDRAEPHREVGSVLEGFKLCLRVWIVVRDVGTAVGFRDVQIDEQLGDGLDFPRFDGQFILHRLEGCL